uniref:dAMP1 SANT/Myb-like domain-containing protein n=1 Tax=Chromera velia CCMP2878 TaxID=1169474 RepID=A0A0G4HXH1_9ALVE|eukprot:Cvel_9258.t1-p1 / transcript=Cvel_9258.t1 / gene=Cvel_9258 / organism=Chromera_velia_CCMP2878 / gene_product=SWR1-complex protein 4, putative / transcript_product=SWR1-complex protein 4, putative / location=Cvel_scaffold529:38108-42405(-) / protein_length=778 / sequence_SO=supercontig / SO=protein_coding / is_pseudo=false
MRMTPIQHSMLCGPGVPSLPLSIPRPAKAQHKLITPVRKWIFKSFRHPSRKDQLRLRHWEPITDAQDPDGTASGVSAEMVETDPYGRRVHYFENPANSFRDLYKLSDRRFPMQGLKLTEAQYDHVIAVRRDGDPTWTKEETLYLFRLCEEFDLRFPIVADKWNYTPTNQSHTPPPARSIEHMKERFYYCARILLDDWYTQRSQEATEEQRVQLEAERAINPLMLCRYSAALDIERKAWIQAEVSQTEEQRRERRRALMKLRKAIEKNKQTREKKETRNFQLVLQATVRDSGEDPEKARKAQVLLDKIEEHKRKLGAEREGSQSGSTGNYLKVISAYPGIGEPKCYSMESRMQALKFVLPPSQQKVPDREGKLLTMEAISLVAGHELMNNRVNKVLAEVFNVRVKGPIVRTLKTVEAFNLLRIEIATMINLQRALLQKKEILDKKRKEVIQLRKEQQQHQYAQLVHTADGGANARTGHHFHPHTLHGAPPPSSHMYLPRPPTHTPAHPNAPHTLQRGSTGPLQHSHSYSRLPSTGSILQHSSSSQFTQLHQSQPQQYQSVTTAAAGIPPVPTGQPIPQTPGTHSSHRSEGPGSAAHRLVFSSAVQQQQQATGQQPSSRRTTAPAPTAAGAAVPFPVSSLPPQAHGQGGGAGVTAAAVASRQHMPGAAPLGSPAPPSAWPGGPQPKAVPTSAVTVGGRGAGGGGTSAPAADSLPPFARQGAADSVPPFARGAAGGGSQPPAPMGGQGQVRPPQMLAKAVPVQSGKRKRGDQNDTGQGEGG